MRLKRMWAMFKARNREFFRDKAAFGWNFCFRFSSWAGLELFSAGKERSITKSASSLEAANGSADAPDGLDLPEDFKDPAI